MKKVIFLIIFPALFLTQCGNDEDFNEQDKSPVASSLKRKKMSRKKDVKCTVITEKVVEAGELFEIKFEFNVKEDKFIPPDFDGVDIISGPFSSSFSSSSVLNGKSQKIVKKSYTYTISCAQAGICKIKPAEIIVDGQSYKTDTTSIRVLGEQNTASPQKQAQQSAGKGIQAKEDIFIHTDYSKTNVFNGEYITLTTKIYTRTDFQNITEIKFPDYSGFWSKALQAPRQLTFRNEVIKGKKYNVAVLKQILLFAVKPGKYTISPYVISLQLKKKQGKTRDFFGNIVDNYKLINKRLRTKAQTIIVKPLPQPVPENFSGLTGSNITIKAEIDTHRFRTDESANLKISLSGTGNLYLLTSLPLNLPKGLKHFDPELELNDKYTPYGEVGDLLFNFIITSDSAGTYTIPPRDFTYFDVDKNNYKTLYTKPLQLNVSGGKSYNPTASHTAVLSGADIRFIKENPNTLRKKDTAFVGNILFYLMYFILIVLFVLLLYMRKSLLKKHADVVGMKKKKAGKVSQKRLKNALTFMKEKDNKAFYKEILNALWGYLSDKLSVNSNDLTKEGIENLLKNKNIETRIISELLNIIEICGYAQYSPAGEEAQPELIYERTKNCITELENLL